MKLEIFLFFLLTTLLAACSPSENVDSDNYELVETTADEAEGSLYILEGYQLNDLELEEETTKNGQSSDTGSEKVCVALKCFPKKSKVKICICIMWKNKD